MTGAAQSSRIGAVQASLDALAAWDFEALAEVFHADLEHESLFAAVEGEVYRGIDGQRRRWQNVNDAWDGFRVTLSEVHDVDEQHAVVILRLEGTARVSGVPLDSELGQVWTWEEGKVRRIVSYAEPGQAYAAAGGQR